jgi:hypothetical protein
MNKTVRLGLLLQIPNALLILVLGMIFVIPYLTWGTVLWATIGSIYAIINITSLILICVGLFRGKENE